MLVCREGGGERGGEGRKGEREEQKSREHDERSSVGVGEVFIKFVLNSCSVVFHDCQFAPNGRFFWVLLLPTPAVSVHHLHRSFFFRAAL